MNDLRMVSNNGDLHYESSFKTKEDRDYAIKIIKDGCPKPKDKLFFIKGMSKNGEYILYITYKNKPNVHGSTETPHQTPVVDLMGDPDNPHVTTL